MLHNGSGMPLPGVQVSLEGITNSFSYSGQTGLDGKIIFQDVFTDVKDNNGGPPLDFSLTEAYPSVTKGQSQFQFYLSKREVVNVKLINVRGREVASQKNVELNPGNYES